MRVFLSSIIFLLLMVTSLQSQTITKWINNNQYYYKIKIVKTGIYKINTAELSSAGVPVSSFSSNNVQLFYKGHEIPIFIKTTGGAISYIEFYGEKNSGWFDVDMYDSAGAQTNPYCSQITDTSSYFLTWNSSTNHQRLTETAYNSSGSVEVSSCTKISANNYYSRFYAGNDGPVYGTTKGWFDNHYISLGNSISKLITLNGILQNTQLATVNIAIVSIGSAASVGVNHHLQIVLPGNFVFDTVFSGLNSIVKSFKIPSSNLQQSNYFVLKSVDDLGVTADYMVTSYINVTYPANFVVLPNELNNLTIPASQQTQLVTLSGLESIQNQEIIDVSNNLKIIPSWNGTNWQFTIPPSSISHEIYVQTGSYSVGNNNIRFAETELQENFTKNYLIITNKQLLSTAQSYASYRNADIVTIDKLYNNFSYGIEKHPLAIRNFLKYLYQTNSLPNTALIIGKSISINESRNNQIAYAQNLVPTMSYPPSDVLMSSKLSTANSIIPEVIIGRIAAKTPQKVTDYLNKVVEFENQSPQFWMKNMLHFGGGANVNEQTIFASYLKQFQTIIEDTLMGVHVSTFLKNSSDPIQTTASDSIRNLINDGSSMLTFFGHGYSEGFDQDIENPDAYNNIGKYPLMMANSCYTGNIHTYASNSASEKWVLAPSKGAIAFIASVYQGYPSILYSFSKIFHQNLAYNKYHHSIGDILHTTMQSFLNQTTSPLSIATALNFTLHGDPSIILNQFEKPDIALYDTKVEVQPHEVTTAIDSFRVRIIASNIGKTISDSITYNIEQIFPDKSDTSIVITRKKLYYQDTINVWLKVNRIKGVGINTINIYADYLGVYQELDETNNSAHINVNVKSLNIYPVFPYPFSYFNGDSIVLRHSTGDPFAKNVHAIIEIDTSSTFSSNFKKQYENDFKGGVIQWSPGIRSEQDKTYYWRVGTTNENNDIEWQTRSFTATNDNHGWVQKNSSQFNSNNLQFLKVNSNQQLEYIDAPKKLICQNIGTPSGQTQINQIYYDLDGMKIRGSCHFVSAMVIAVFDSITLQPWLSNIGEYGQNNYPHCNTSSHPNGFFTFEANTDGLTSMTNFLNNVVPEGAYILAYSFYNGDFENWTNSYFEAFEDMGAIEIRAIPNYYPYIFFTQKGFSNKTQERIGTNSDDIINLSVDLKSNFDYGFITTPWIGPAKQWDKFSWSFKESTIETSDSVMVNVIGHDQTNNLDTVLIGNIEINSSPVDLSSINISTFPVLKFQFLLSDKINRTPVQPLKFECNYTPVSDLAISPTDDFFFKKDTLEEGDDLIFHTAIKNLSDIKSIPKSIKFWVTNSSNKTIATTTKTIGVLDEYKFEIDSTVINTRNITGDNLLWVQINNQSYNEFFTFNNIGSIPFYVKKDETNPLLDVTFDGRHILNGEIINAHPTITITLTDENKYVELNDTTLFSIYIKNTLDGTEQRVYFSQNMSNGTLQWEPAATSDNTAKIIYTPTFSQDGTYQLRVRAKDMASNSSGSNDYQIKFEIINKSTITNILNYPNPFSTKTRFVFTLTGSVIPDELTIQLYTITGKKIKTITQDELGPIYIGRNITDYYWDGTDDYGDRLANGVYLYKISTKIDNKNIELRTNTIDKYFKKGWGKLYIIR